MGFQFSGKTGVECPPLMYKTTKLIKGLNSNGHVKTDINQFEGK